MRKLKMPRGVRAAALAAAVIVAAVLYVRARIVQVSRVVRVDGLHSASGTCYRWLDSDRFIGLRGEGSHFSVIEYARIAGKWREVPTVDFAHLPANVDRFPGFFSISSDGRRAIWSTDAHGNRMAMMSAESGRLAVFNTGGPNMEDVGWESGTHRWLEVVRAKSGAGWSVSTLDTDAGVSQPVTEPWVTAVARVGPRAGESVVVTPERATFCTYLSLRNSYKSDRRFEIVTCRRAGALVRHTVSIGDDNCRPIGSRVSPDGRYVAFRVQSERAPTALDQLKQLWGARARRRKVLDRVYLVDSDTGAQRMLRESAFDMDRRQEWLIGMEWLPDSRSISYVQHGWLWTMECKM